MRIVNRTRGTVIGSRITVASGWWSRLRGFLGRPRPIEGEGILLAPCNAVHTYGMTYPLDVLFLSAEGRVLSILGSFPPWKRTTRVPEARYVLELPAGTVEASATLEGDAFTWMPPRSGTVSNMPDRGTWAPESETDSKTTTTHAGRTS